MMGRWASLYDASEIQFLMVCVDRAGVAVQFGRMFDLRGVVNCFIPSRGYMPVGFGQLGCSGFVISDRDGCFVSRKTKAYLQYGDDAFLHVEKLLEEKFNLYPRKNDDHDGKKTAKPDNEDVLSPNWSLPSVGITSMDSEHKECEDALSDLLKNLNKQSLTRVMEILTEHFQHEEQLMKSSGFGNPGLAFSPFANHVKDHERILEIGYKELGKHSQEEGKMTCSDKGGNIGS
jgi:hemerythrin